MIRPHWALIPEEAGDPLTPLEILQAAKRLEKEGRFLTGLTPYDVYVAGRAVRIPKWQARLEILPFRCGPPLGEFLTGQGWAKGAKAKLDQLLAEEAA